MEEVRYYSDQGVCEKCYLSCTTCSGPRKDHCIDCPQGWKLAAGECQPECPEGFYSSNFGCNRCEGPLNCTSCPPHYTPQGGLCTRCLSSQYYEATTQTCGPCHDSCRTCAGPNAFSCVTCLSPLQLDTFSQQCVKCCRGGQRKSCCHCDKITVLALDVSPGTCHNSSPAGKRRKAVSADQTLRKDHDYHKDSGGTTEELVPFDAMAPLIGSACVAVIMLSVLVLAILQPWSLSNPHQWVRGQGRQSRFSCDDQIRVRIQAECTLRFVHSSSTLMWGRSRLKCKLWRSGDGYKRLSTDQSCVNADKEVTAQECDSVADTNSHNEELQFMKI
uniref:Uncharacterized protein n=1 Tax=Timema tahoe TaxID=61484 RepID=A0A7R9NYS3_9NEOP|nr:unnamed protein product [Timema tahoe]